MKSQLIRIRRLCSRQTDYIEAAGRLKERCKASGYKDADIQEVFANFEDLSRELEDRVREDDDNMYKVRLITLAGTPYAADIEAFAGRMNRVLVSSRIHVQIVKTTGPSLAKLLFRNNTNFGNEVNCGNCIICRSGGMNDTGVVKRTVTGINPIGSLKT